MARRRKAGVAVWAGVWPALRGLMPWACARRSLADFGTGRDSLIWALALLAPAALAAGLWLPVLRVQQPFLFGLFSRTDRLSVIGQFDAFLGAGAYLPAAALLLVAAVFPLLRLFQAWHLWRRVSISDRRFDRRLALLRWLGWWSLAEVAALGLFILHVNYRGMADAETRPGLYLLAAGLCGILLVQMLVTGAALKVRGRGLVEYAD